MKRIQSHKGVVGTIVVNAEGIWHVMAINMVDINMVLCKT